MAKNSIVIICKNIKIDKNYQNCLTYSENEMQELCYSNRINMANTFSFIKEGDNVIRVPFSYQECLSSNYLAFQNPRYSNKWFFAFIDSVEYVSDGATNINFTVDEFSTWWSYWSPVETFVVREHTNDDTVGSNLIDEGLGLGDYICQHVNNRLNPFNSFKPVIGVSEVLVDNKETARVPKYYEAGGIFNGVCYIIGEASPYATSRIVGGYDEAGKAGSIQYIFMAPTEIINSYTVNYVEPLVGYSDPISFGYITDSTSSYYFPGYADTFGSESDPYFYRPLAIGDYIPENKKLLTYPYCYLMVDPHDGNSYKFNYEDFEDIYYSFNVYGVLTPGCSVKFVPLKYKGVAENFSYAFSGAKMPMCSWNSDAYTNWLTQNGVNLGFTTLNQNEIAGIAGAGSIALGGLLMATGIGSLFGAGLLATGATGIFSSMQNDYKASMLPDQVKGNQNTGDVNYSLKLINPTCYEMTIKEEKAKSIDEYFTRFGYKTNRLKTPNQTGRKYFNYVEIGKSEVIGYPKTTAGIPAESMEKINNIYRGGVTLWHDHERIGNYAGNIITNPTPPPTPPPSPETTVIDTNVVVNDVNINKANYINLLGNTLQDGTPTPDDPKEIKVVTDNILVQISNSNNSLQTIHPVNLRDIELCKIGEYQDGIYKSTGKNLANFTPNTQLPLNANTIIIDFGEDKTFDNITTSFYLNGAKFTNASGGIINYQKNDGTNQYILPGNFKNSNNVSMAVNTSLTGQYSKTETGITFRKAILTNNYPTFTQGTMSVQIELGNQATEYEPYGTQWYIHKEIGKVVLDGSEVWSYNSVTQGSLFRSTNTITNHLKDDTYSPYSDYYKGIPANNVTNRQNNQFYIQTNFNYLDIIDNRYTNSDDFKNWLSSNNVSIYYILATPTNTEITDTELTTQLDQLYTAGLFSGTTRIVSYTNGDNPYIKLHYNIS